MATLKTSSGSFTIPKSEFLDETAEIKNKKGELFNGVVLGETEEEFVLRTQYGDAVVIIPPPNPVPYIKRLIGKPGDTIRIINKQIYINGTALDRSFIDTEEIIIKKRYKYSSGEIVEREMEAVGDLYSEKHGEAEYLIRHTRGENNQYPQEWTVPKDHYFVMGDNRDNSNDSTKDVGFVPRENFFGRADYLWMTWECWTCLPSFKKVGRIN